MIRNNLFTVPCGYFSTVISFGGSKKIHILLAILFLVTAVRTELLSCDFCNKQFYKELLGERGKSLTGQELLAAINAQGVAPHLSPGGAVTPPAAEAPDKTDFTDLIERAKRSTIPQTSYVPQDVKADKSFTITLGEGETYIGKGVMFKGFTTDKKIPGPTLEANEGDIIEMTFENKGTIPHGASLHMAYTQTSKYLGKIEAGKSKSFKFRVTYPGVYMYHCAPGGHAIPMHILFGQYGMMVVHPKKKFKLEQVLNKKPDVEIYLLQHEFYSSGKDAIDGHPVYVTFNGKLFRYVEEPIKAKPGDYVRIYFLNAGPNLVSTFHIVGIIWDYAYWQGNPDVVYPGGQSVIAGPTDSWVVEFRVPPDEGAFLMLSHAVGSTDRGAIGILTSDRNAQTPVKVSADGPSYTDQELTDLKSKSVRTIAPFEPGTPDVDPPFSYGQETNEVTVKIIGNSFYPKIIEITKGTRVKWINEDVFTYMEGEFAGIHNVVAFEGPDRFGSPLLGHAESFSFTFEKEGEFKYMCTPHPYMKGQIIVKEKTPMASSGGGATWAIGLSAIAIIFGSAALFVKR
ncbi:MAG: multicopper oxidase domain-containing protein [Bacteroidetes bacterium]|nr:multicopper oxidase domain-containing protein [Bacteroidota bacterium]